jgi:hypothetical protein
MQLPRILRMLCHQGQLLAKLRTIYRKGFTMNIETDSHKSYGHRLRVEFEPGEKTIQHAEGWPPKRVVKTLSLSSISISFSWRFGDAEWANGGASVMGSYQLKGGEFGVVKNIDRYSRFQAVEGEPSDLADLIEALIEEHRPRTVVTLVETPEEATA